MVDVIRLHLCPNYTDYGVLVEFNLSLRVAYCNLPIKKWNFYTIGADLYHCYRGLAIYICLLQLKPTVKMISQLTNSSGLDHKVTSINASVAMLGTAPECNAMRGNMAKLFR